MKAIVCEKPGAIRLEDRPEPTPKPGEALIRIRRIGICGTDFHIYQGKHPYLEYPRVMGHELSGVVAKAGPCWPRAPRAPASPGGEGSSATICRSSRSFSSSIWLS